MAAFKKRKLVVFSLLVAILAMAVSWVWGRSSRTTTVVSACAALVVLVVGWIMLYEDGAPKWNVVLSDRSNSDGEGTCRPVTTGNHDQDVYQVPLRVLTISCATCAKTGKDLEHCARCKQIYFCSRECQKKAWKWHKADCKQAAAGTAALRPDSGVRAFDYLSVAQQALAKGDTKKGLELATTALDMAKRTGNVKEQADGYQLLGKAHAALGDLVAADESYRLMAVLGKEREDIVVEGSGLIGRGFVARRVDANSAEALALFEQAIDLASNAFASHKDKEAVVSMEASARASRGRCLAAQGRTQEALQDLRQVVSLRRLSAAAADSATQKGLLGNALIALASATVNSPDAGGEEAAVPILEEALKVSVEAGDAHTENLARVNLKTIRSTIV